MFSYNQPNSFSRRIGRSLSQLKKRLLVEFLPQVIFKNEDLVKYSQFYSKIYCEIGFGNGERLYEEAKNSPSILYLGAEPFINGTGELLKRLRNDPTVTNIRIWPDDARQLLEQLPNDYLDKLFVLYPDPWPKKKHFKRRIINYSNLEMFANKLKVNGYLNIATDHKDYSRWILVETLKSKLFQWDNPEVKDYFDFPQNWIKTRYQEKSKSGNSQHLFLNYRSIKNC
jgi:tRNA (guanine-N7-)-methyltransferase